MNNLERRIERLQKTLGMKPSLNNPTEEEI